MKNPQQKSYKTVAGWMKAHAEYVKWLEKTHRDLLNWAKSELAELEHPKLGKTVTAYSTEKKLFLTKVIQKLT